MIPLEAIEQARARIASAAVRIPLVRLVVDAPCEIYLKLECLQPIGSFKIRGATNAIRSADSAALARGVVTASAGNMGQGVAWAARELGVPCTVVVPDGAAETKVAAIERLGGKVVKVPYEEWWEAIATSSTPAAQGRFVHPVEDEAAHDRLPCLLPAEPGVSVRLPSRFSEDRRHCLLQGNLAVAVHPHERLKRWGFDDGSRALPERRNA